VRDGTPTPKNYVPFDSVRNSQRILSHSDALESESKRKFLNGQMIEQFKDFGGVRIEDTFLITSNGSQSLISVPKEIGDIELLMNP
jgi:hypothetical protein